MSGDRTTAVARVARALGLTAQTAMLLANKLDAIMRQQRMGHRVSIMGNRLNNGAALRILADVTSYAE
jgi:P-type Cu2+ transporter